jgi:ADP-heptose:LPS heptosyltransferase
MTHYDRKPTPNTTKRILAVSIGGLGDTILFSPVLKSLRSRFPRAHIELLLASKLARLAFAPANEIDRIFVINTDHPFLPARVAGLLPYSFRSRLSGGFEVGVFATGLNPKFVTLLSNLAGIRRVCCAPKSPQSDTDLSCNVALARCFDGSISENDVFFPVTKEAREEAREQLARHGIRDSSQILAVYPSSNLTHRPRWPLEKLAKVIELLRNSSFSGKVVVIGSREEGKEWESLGCGNVADVNLAGSLNISAVGALLSKCSLALGNDGGVMHVGGAVGCPLVVIMTTAPASYRPAGDRVRVVNSNLVCGVPFSKKRNRISSSAVLANNIEIGEVLEACREQLARPKIAS